MQKPSSDIWAWFAVLLIPAALVVVTLPLREAAFGTAFAAITLWMARSDIQSFELPDLGSVALFCLGITFATSSSDNAINTLLDCFARAGVAGLFLVAIRVLYRMARQVEGLGFGDVKLAAAGAVWLSWDDMPIALLLAAGAGILAMGIHALKNGRAIDVQTAIPLGAFLAPAIWIVWYGGRLSFF